MSVTEAGKIDVVATRPGSRVVKLVITDHLDWNYPDEHYRLIQDKINSYLGFIESGQLSSLKSPPIPDDPDIWITLALENAPDGPAKAFLDNVAAFLRNVGVTFEMEVR